MSLPEGQYSPLAAATRALVAGSPVLLVDEEREHEGDIAFAAASCSPDAINFCRRAGGGLICLALRAEDAVRLGIPRLPTNSRDPFETPFGMPIGLPDGTSGVSAAARAATIRAAADPACTHEDIAYPGHVPTLVGHPRGLAARVGHTEGILELLRLAGIPGPAVLCEVLGEAGSVARPGELATLAQTASIPYVRLSDVVKAAR